MPCCKALNKLRARCLNDHAPQFTHDLMPQLEADATAVSKQQTDFGAEPNRARFFLHAHRHCLGAISSQKAHACDGEVAVRCKQMEDSVNRMQETNVDNGAVVFHCIVLL